ncbi:DUF3389 domain-containing protein [Vibrio diabolicus]|mgnify:FL=1|jgi:uncharacterized cupin superfamily protein|uniref:DUF3389 domain-containing protein n=2 Tax=Vibrio TaxID=662 RepID=A0ABM6SJ33_9VIBR|nr:MULTISPECIES: DUF3389 domain-containing protein [Vibrio]KOY45127.1 PTS sugar transporter subunit IIA [Vibrio parahaemolyticus]MCR9565241.1 DUF3389 domain-containing protein [Vibrio alginolyticus]MEA3484751.1 DUF3389 domain-containing protein [Pseudomonadota bacterium]AVH29925.1 DUF3389 domain-containing protein [Vibrio diabolicus]EMD78712.1 phosphotransferase system IIA component [Vibrio diabolicus E0666]
MVIEFSLGKIIATQREIVIKLSGSAMVTLQAQTDSIQLLGRGANVVLSHGAECKWSIKLDNEEQLADLAREIGIDIQ